MAFYKYPQFLQQENTQEYDVTYNPGTTTPISGVYRCEGCGRSVTSVKDHPFPPQNHHEHNPSQGHIRWRLVVKSHWIR
jgi:hypothetical protein